MIKLRTLISSVVMGSTIAGLIYQPAFAVTQPTNGLKVSPAIVSVQVAPGQSTYNFNETVTNVTNNLLAVAITTKDFGALNGYGDIGFYGSSYKPSSNPHSLSSSFDLSNQEFLIQAHQTQNIPITINNIDQLSPGGHYSAIVFVPVLEKSISTKNQVSVQPSVASLVFLTTSTGGTQSLKLNGYNVPTVGFSLSMNVYALLNNSGNTQTIPRGVVSITNSSNKLITQEVINSESGLILPSTSRLFNVDLSPHYSLFRLSGIYHVNFKYRTDSSKNYQNVTKNYLYINPADPLYLAALITILVLIRKSSQKSPSSKKTKNLKKKSK